MVTTLIITLCAFVGLLAYTCRGIYLSCQKPVGGIFKIKDRKFEIMAYDPTSQRPKCFFCDMKHFPVMAGRKNGVCTRVPFCNSVDRRDRKDVYFILKTDENH